VHRGCSQRVSKARTTLAVVSARQGDLDAAIDTGNAALDIPRQSVPSLLMVTDDLVTELRSRYKAEAGTADYLDRIRSLGKET
jgi:hypothetical protein